MGTKKSFSSPGRIIILSLMSIIALGAFLLWLPFCNHGSLSFLNALFMATSATCVTGLQTVPLSSFTFPGHCVILLLMQVGGLGLVTLTIFLLSLFFELKLSTRNFTEQMLEIESWNASHHLLLFIVGLTVLAESVGTGLIFLAIKDQYPTGTALFYSFFHAVSSFTTAGLSFLENSQGELPFQLSILAPTAALVFIGGIGFIVWDEVLQFLISRNSSRRFHWSLHSKIVFSVTGLIISTTSVMFYYLEYVRGNHHESFIYTILSVFFNAITCRSAGFTTFSISTIHLATLFLIMIIAFIGSSPGSTGSGIKTTTFALFLAAIRATITRRDVVEIKGRSIPHEQIFKAMAILSLSLSWIAVTIFWLLITEQGWRFIDISFEAFSAFANLGLTTGLTEYLSPLGKCIVIMSMFLGRIGSLTLLLAFKKQKEKKEFHYPEERVILG